MSSARRLDLYGVTAISLLALSFALRSLIALALFSLGVDSDRGSILTSDEALRRSTIFALALALVSLPVWGLHWWLCQRAAGNDEDDRSSIIRAIFLLGISAIGTIVFVVQFNSLLSGCIAGWYSDTQSVSDLVDLDRTLANLVIASAVVVYHVRERWRDVHAVAMHGASDWLGRLFVHAFIFTGAWMIGLGVARLLALGVAVISHPPAMIAAEPWGDPLATASSLAFSGLVIWVPSWAYSLNTIAPGSPHRSRWLDSNIGAPPCLDWP